MKKALLLATALAFSAAAIAEQYKWTDKDGKVQYGDAPPPGVKATPLRAPPGPAAAPPAAKKEAQQAGKALTPEQAFQKRQKDQQAQEQQASKERADAEAKRVNCDAAQANLRTLQSGQRIQSTNAAGERVFIDDAQRAKEIERAQRSVGEFCK